VRSWRFQPTLAPYYHRYKGRWPLTNSGRPATLDMMKEWGRKYMEKNKRNKNTPHQINKKLKIFASSKIKFFARLATDTDSRPLAGDKKPYVIKRFSKLKYKNAIC
jgi:hypothetical protein